MRENREEQMMERSIIQYATRIDPRSIPDRRQEVQMATLSQTLHKIRGPDNKRAVEAIEELRARGWLEDGSMEGILLCHARLEGADLFKASLPKVDFHQAHLFRADFSGADLTSAKFARADLRSANFSGAILDDADLLKADLSGATNLTDAQLAKAKRLCYATMPDGLPYDGRFRLQGDLDLAEWGKVDVEDPEAMAYFLGVSLETYLNGQKLLEKAKG
jgi:hypothetical protein